MEPAVDAVQPLETTAVSLESWRPWVLALAREGESPLVESGADRYSYLTECECPKDCLRDHENE